MLEAENRFSWSHKSSLSFIKGWRELVILDSSWLGLSLSCLLEIWRPVYRCRECSVLTSCPLAFLMTTFYYHSYEYFEHLRNRNRPFVLIRKNVRQICFDARLLTKKSWEIRILIEICIKVYSSFPLQTCRFWCIFVISR